MLTFSVLLISMLLIIGAVWVGGCVSLQESSQGNTYNGRKRYLNTINAREIFISK